jgi:transcriptional antiterminator RfaH
MIETRAANWCVVQTHTHAENKAALNLERQGFDTYFPRYLKRRRHARRVENVPAPLFPRYLFVGFDEASGRWRSIQSTLGVSHLVRNGESPAIISARVVDELRSREDGKGFVELSLPSKFVQGESIRVIDGVFGSCFGSFDGMVDRDRVAILLDLLGRKVRVVIDEGCVTAA